MKIILKKSITSEQGFTIIELMIATVVLATILLLASDIMINISSLYSKGVYMSQIQDSVRTTADEIAQDLQLTPATSSFTIGQSLPIFSPYTNQVQSLCIGDVRYSYIIGYALNSGGGNDRGGVPYINHVLWRDINSTGPNLCPALPLYQAGNNPSQGVPTSSNGTELVPADARLTALSITPNASGSYSITVSEAYGSSDLLKSGNGTSPPSGPSTVCITQIGDRYCGTASITVSATPRL